jgi:DEAD/DEAH box helicase domain-containing protein
LGLIKKDPDLGPALIHDRHLPESAAEYGPDLDMTEEIHLLVRNLKIEKLFKHQVEALKLIRQGKHVLVATPTASGKSLIYNLAVLEKLLKDDQAKALYLFPLKALEQDQLKNLAPMLKGIARKKITAAIYDGDTSAYRRKQIKNRLPEILFSNPDMLHSAILPYHQQWAPFLQNLQFIILDEVHTYRGIFGSHMNQVIRRLKRLCALYGSHPQFILSSATIANPAEFGQSLIEEQIKIVTANGAPRAGQYFLFLNPEASPNFSAAQLFCECLRHGFRTIAFTQSRKITELIHLWVTQLSPALAQKVSSYRAGFMPEERRVIEKRLAGGELLGVVSTSALEMGIDIGYLDICLLVGYPGTIINTWQRGGRVGRSGQESMIILIAKPDALDQYFMRHPDDLFARSYEAALLDPHNPFVIADHLPCAAAEKPLTLADQKYWSKDFKVHLEQLELNGALRRSAEEEPVWFASRRHPHQQVNIRSVGEGYTIFEKETGEAIGTIDGIRALKEGHPGAVYLHRGQQFLIEKLDLEKRDILARKTDLKYFTRTRSEKQTEIIQIMRSRPEGQFLVREGRLKVTEWIVGYEKRALPGQELIGAYDLELPPQTFETVGFWIELEPAIEAWIEKQGLHFMGGIHAIEHGAIGIFPLFALCDRNDIGGICYPFHPQVGKGAIFIYDGYPGGVGLAQRGFEVVLELLQATLKHLQTCACEDGCPSCIHSPKCGSGNKPLDKKAAILILEFLTGRIPFASIADSRAEEQTMPIEAEVQRKGLKTAALEPCVVYLDLETQKLAQDVGGWKNIHLMRISVGVLYDSLAKEFFTFTEDQVEMLLPHLEQADLIVGFNIKGFDYKVLGAYTNKDLTRLKTFDILEDIYERLGFRLSLDHLAGETLGQGKSADGLQAVAWFAQGEMEKLMEYCRQDVIVTRDLFLFGLKHGYLIYRSKMEGREQRVRLRVDWNLEKILKESQKAG